MPEKWEVTVAAMAERQKIILEAVDRIERRLENGDGKFERLNLRLDRLEQDTRRVDRWRWALIAATIGAVATMIVETYRFVFMGRP